MAVDFCPTDDEQLSMLLADYPEPRPPVREVPTESLLRAEVRRFLEDHASELAPEVNHG